MSSSKSANQPTCTYSFNFRKPRVMDVRYASFKTKSSNSETGVMSRVQLGPRTEGECYLLQIPEGNLRSTKSLFQQACLPEFQPMLVPIALNPVGILFKPTNLHLLQRLVEDFKFVSMILHQENKNPNIRFRSSHTTLLGK